ncbi:hybrid sensor histidine kinase/response regulator [Vibrio sp.]|uniref:hybrid sensor histidine kinase/response regulator n=1 Tax=Vibrio sp. TaxID=678 RepID=UPI003D0AD8D9
MSINTWFDMLLYPKALTLMTIALVVAYWLGYFIYSLTSKNIYILKSHYIYYACYSINIMLWILTNAFFHTGFISYVSTNFSIVMATAANITAYCAFAFAYLFSSALRAKLSGSRIKRHQKGIFSLFTSVALIINLVPGLTISGIDISGPSQFVIHFGPYTSLFFTMVVILIVLTIINLIAIKISAPRINQQQSNYMIAGILVFMLSTVSVQVVMTYFWGDFSLTWLPPALSISEMLFVGYALITSRFYSGKYLFYITLSYLLCGAIFAFPLALLSASFELDAPGQFATTIILCLTIGLLWRSVLRITGQISSLLLYKTRSSPVEQILALEQDFQYSTAAAITKLASLLDIPGDKLQLITTNLQHRLYTDHLKAEGNVLVAEEIDPQQEYADTGIRDRLRKLKQRMNASDTALVLPLFDQDATISHLLVSASKSNGRLFSYEEIHALQNVLAKVQGYINADRKVQQSQALATSIAHEMRNPLAQVQLKFEALQSEISGANSRVKLLDEIDAGLNAVDRGRQLIDIILREVSDSSLDHEPLSPVPVHHAIQQAVERYGFDHPQDQQRVHLQLGADFTINVNETLFNFVVFNLLRNAIYYFDSYPKSEIFVSTETSEFGNRVLFKDTGPGVPADIIDRIFDDFYSYNKSGGSGLGLGYCHRVMQAFGGRISCQSEPGRYTVFQLEFPVLQLPELDAFPQPESKIRLADFSAYRLRVLVVDDKQVQRSLVQLYLQQAGIEVLQANNGLVAINMLKQQEVDLILMDIQMPIMDGFAASRIIREFLPQTPILALSGESGPRELETITELMDGRLSKPTTKQALIEAVQQHCHAKCPEPA